MDVVCVCHSEAMDYSTPCKCSLSTYCVLAGRCYELGTLKSFTIYFSLACLLYQGWKAQILHFLASLAARYGNLKLFNGHLEKPSERDRLPGQTL